MSRLRRRPSPLQWVVLDRLRAGQRVLVDGLRVTWRPALKLSVSAAQLSNMAVRYGWLAYDNREFRITEAGWHVVHDWQGRLKPTAYQARLMDRLLRGYRLRAPAGAAVLVLEDRHRQQTARIDPTDIEVPLLLGWLKTRASGPDQVLNLSNEGRRALARE